MQVCGHCLADGFWPWWLAFCYWRCLHDEACSKTPRSLTLTRKRCSYAQQGALSLLLHLNIPSAAFALALQRLGGAANPAAREIVHISWVALDDSWLRECSVVIANIGAAWEVFIMGNWMVVWSLLHLLALRVGVIVSFGVRRRCAASITT